MDINSTRFAISRYYLFILDFTFDHLLIVDLDRNALWLDFFSLGQPQGDDTVLI